MGPEFLQALRPAFHRATAPQESAEFYWKRGVEYSKKGLWDQAFADFNKALEIDPKFAKAYNSRGHIYGRKGLFDQAIAALTRALEINRNDAPAYEWRAFALVEEKEYDQAWEDARQAQSLGHEVNPKFLQALRKASGRQN